MLSPLSEPVKSWIQREELELQEALYKVPATAVYKAYSRKMDRPVVVKLHCAYGRNAKVMLEPENQRKLEHSKVVQIYHSSLFKTKSHSILCLIEELMTSDLCQDIHLRSGHNRPPTDSELRQFMVEIVEVLASAQALGIAHRDIKPQNVFVSGKGYKIGDFGWSRKVEDIRECTSLCGTPCYLSPALYQAMMFGEQQVAHNPYKSDVFSLGLTIIAFIRLQEDPSLNSSTESLYTLICSLPCEDWLKRLLVLMLHTEELSRPDFMELSAILRASSSCGHACSHIVSCGMYQACGECLRPEEVITHCMEFVRGGGQLTGTPSGMSQCSICHRVLVEGDLVYSEEPLGFFCFRCLQDKLDDQEVAKRCRSSWLSFVFHAVQNAL